VWNYNTNYHRNPWFPKHAPCFRRQWRLRDVRHSKSYIDSYSYFNGITDAASYCNSHSDCYGNSYRNTTMPELYLYSH